VGTGLERYYYKFAFALPRSIILPVVLSAVVDAAYVRASRLLGAFMILLGVAELAALRILAGRGVATARRLCWLHFLVGLVSTAYTYIYGVGYGLIAYPLLTGFMTSFAIGVAPSLQRLLLYPATGVILTALAGIRFLEAYLIGSALALTPIIVSTILFGPKRGIRLMRVVTAHLRAWLADDYEMVAKIMGCERRETYTHILSYKLEDGGCISIIIPGVHFGPFRAAGSSTLPYRIREYADHPVMVLHGTVGHELDVASVEESNRLAKLIADAASRACRTSTESGAMMAQCVEVAGFRVKSLPGNPPILVIDRPRVGIDDLRLPVTATPTVDLHNEEQSRWPTSKEINTLVDELSKLATRKCKELEVSLVEIPVSEETASRLGLCGGFLQAFVARCDDTFTGILLAYSNNAVKGVREVVEEIMKVHGVDGVLATIDDHLCSGVKPGVPSYTLSNIEAATGLIVEAVKQAVLSLKRVVGVVHEILVERVTVWGRCFAEVTYFMKRGKPVVWAVIAAFIAAIAAPYMLYSFAHLAF